MKVFVNDETKEVSQATTLLSLLDDLGIKDSKGWALALNELVIPKSMLKETQLSDGDRVMLIRATQGG